jgi:hypothetical protein
MSSLYVIISFRRLAEERPLWMNYRRNDFLCNQPIMSLIPRSADPVLLHDFSFEYNRESNIFLQSHNICTCWKYMLIILPHNYQLALPTALFILHITLNRPPTRVAKERWEVTDNSCHIICDSRPRKHFLCHLKPG